MPLGLLVSNCYMVFALDETSSTNENENTQEETSDSAEEQENPWGEVKTEKLEETIDIQQDDDIQYGIDEQELTTSTTQVQMWRLYDYLRGEHFYTSTVSERDSLYNVGWNIEGYGWVSPSSSNTPVYRLYNPNAGDHHYTKSEAEKDNLVSLGWRYEGISWYAVDGTSNVPIYREYNPNAKTGAHNFTTNIQEHWQLINAGWKDEGIAFYVVGKGSQQGTKEHWNGLDNSKMQQAVSKIGTQTDEKYGSKSYNMCSAYAISLLRSAVFNDNREPATYWTDNGGAHWSWGGGTDRRYVDVFWFSKLSIDGGRAAIIHVSNHYVVAFAYRGYGNKMADFKVLDPWDGTIRMLSSYSLHGDGQVISF